MKVTLLLLNSVQGRRELLAELVEVELEARTVEKVRLRRRKRITCALRKVSLLHSQLQTVDDVCDDGVEVVETLIDGIQRLDGHLVRGWLLFG